MQTIEMTVTEKGFEPAAIEAKRGEVLRLRVLRTVARTCATSVEVPGMLPKTRLPLGETVEVTFTPTTIGTFRFGCSMGQHIGGSLRIEE